VHNVVIFWAILCKLSGNVWAPKSWKYRDSQRQHLVLLQMADWGECNCLESKTDQINRKLTNFHNMPIRWKFSIAWPHWSHAFQWYLVHDNRSTHYKLSSHMLPTSACFSCGSWAHKCLALLSDLKSLSKDNQSLNIVNCKETIFFNRVIFVKMHLKCINFKKTVLTFCTQTFFLMYFRLFTEFTCIPC
jgi:hypothetical protein